MFLASRCRAAAYGGAGLLKPRSMLQQSRKLSRSTPSRNQHQQGAPGAQAKAAEATHQTKPPIISAERVGKLTLAFVSAYVITSALNFSDDNSSRAATAGDMSSWSAPEAAAFLAALGEAVGKEHVSTDEGE